MILINSSKLLFQVQKMKFAVFLLIFSLCGVIAEAQDLASTKEENELGNEIKKGKVSPRPSFTNEVTGLLKDMAQDNGYTSFDKCHVIPWQFIQNQVQNNFQNNKPYLQELIDDLSEKHSDATFYKKHKGSTRTTLNSLINRYKTKANQALQNDEAGLLKALFNMPSNLFPGDSSINKSVQGNFDAPRKGTASSRGDQATKQAKELWVKYQGDGLTVRIDLNNRPKGTWAKSSDNPPTDQKLYVEIQ